MSDGVSELVPDKLYMLGGAVEADGRVSWIRDNAPRYSRLSCYLLKDEDKSLLVDTGGAAHADEIMQGLVQVLPQGSRLDVFLTRAESDCLGNLGRVAAQYEIENLFAGGALNPFDYFDDAGDTMIAEGSEEDLVRRSIGLTVQRKRPGEHIRISDSRTFEVHAAPLRLLRTFWGYDTATEALFTADCFTHGGFDDLDSRPVVDSLGVVSVEDVAATLFTKLDWMELVDRTPLQHDLANLFESRAIQHVAPTHGAAISGRAVVAEHYELMQAALA